MFKTAEAVSLGHPDKTADYISSFLLDSFLKQDPHTKYAVEVMIKDNTVVLGGEVKTSAVVGDIRGHVLNALSEIGYTKDYAAIWKDKAIEPDKINVINLIGAQSSEINQGVEQNGWGDQGVYVGYACQGENNISPEQNLARKLNSALYKKALCSQNLGLDIKTQITLNDDGKIQTAIAAVPMLKKEDLQDFVVQVLGQKPEQIIINGTGDYTTHSSIADCGVAGRKLCCDFYEAASPIGGGSPWTKDASKADLTLNLYARQLALENLKDNDECFVYLSSCIGQSDLPSGEIKTVKNGKTESQKLYKIFSPRTLIEYFGLNKPVFTALCRKSVGL